MSDESTPKYVHISVAVKNGVFALSAVGALIVFLRWESPAKTAQLMSHQVDARVKSEVEPYLIGLKRVETELKGLQTRRERAESELAEIEVRKSSRPVLTVRPVVEQTPSLRDVREIRIEIHLENTGPTDVVINELMVEVYGGGVKENVHDMLERTERISDCLAILRSYGAFNHFSPPNWVGLSEEATQACSAAWKEYEELHLDCPHGNIYLVGEESDDVSWKKAERATKTRRTRMQLAPSQSVCEPFVYVVTEALWLHRRWFRFVVTVNPTTTSEQHFEFVVPMLRPWPEVMDSSLTTVKPVYETRSRSRPVFYRWEPASSLLPAIRSPESEVTPENQESSKSRLKEERGRR